MTKNRVATFVFGAALCAAAGPAVAGDGTNLTSMIAADTQMVMVFDVADSRDSTLLQKGYQKLLATQPDAQKKLTEIGIDPMKDIDTILFAGGGVAKIDDFDDAKSMVLIIEGRLPKGKLALMPNAKKALYQGVEIWTKDETDAAFVGDRLFFSKKGKMKGAIDIALGKGKGKGNNVALAKKAAKLRDAIKSTDTAADLWMTVLIPDKDKKNMAKDGVTAESVGGGVNFTADLGMFLRVVSNNEEGAKKAVGMIQAQLGQLTGAMQQMGLTKAAKSLSVSQDKATIKFALTLTEAEINSLMALAGVAQGSAPTAPPATPPAKGGTLQPMKKTP